MEGKGRPRGVTPSPWRWWGRGTGSFIRCSPAASRRSSPTGAGRWPRRGWPTASGARWETYLRRIAASSFLTGHRRGARFLIDLTTALDPDWIARIDEGKYDNAEGEMPTPTQHALTLLSVYKRDATDVADTAAPSTPEVDDASAAGPEPWGRVVAEVAGLRGGMARRWLDPLTCRGLGTDGVVRLEAPSAFVRGRVKDWYASDIRTLWAERTGQAVRGVEVEMVMTERPAVATEAAGHAA